MAPVINTNIPALIAQYRLGLSTKQVGQSMERLSSGYRINRASDDAAGLNISQSLTSQIRRMNQNQRNVQDGISALQVAEDGLATISEILQRVRELTLQAANDTSSSAARSAITQEISMQLREIDRIALATNFNGINLLNGSATNAVIQIGPNSNLTTNTLNVTTALAAAGTGDAAGPGGLAIVGGAATFTDIANITTVGLNSTTAPNFLTDIDQALQAVNTRRARIGAFSNQLDNISLSLMSSIETLQASNSRIRDVDVASETSTLAQNQVLQQAAVSVLAQANDLPQMILRLMEARS